MTLHQKLILRVKDSTTSQAWDEMPSADKQLRTSPAENKEDGLGDEHCTLNQGKLHHRTYEEQCLPSKHASVGSRT